MSVEAFEALCTPNLSGAVVIVGSRVYGDKEDRRKRYAEGKAFGLDMQAGEGVSVVIDLEERHWPVVGASHIECMSVLEHSRRPWLMAANIERMLMPSGTLFITVPFIWRIHGYPDDYWRMSVSGVKSLFTAIDWKQEAYSGRGLTEATGIPSVRSADDWPCFGRTETCLFGVKR